MLTAITEVTRNASKSSRGLVSIGSRLIQVVDESSSTGKALTEIYNSLGIELYDAEGQLRSSYDIFSDLAEIWDTLDTNTQNYIASIQAGTNQFKWDCFHSNMIEKILLNCWKFHSMDNQQLRPLW